jgi:hypothetical protein
MQETALHSVLKDLYTKDGDHQEVLVDGYIVDVVSGNILIEIQTRNFYAIRSKIAALIERHPVWLIHTIPQEKWIVYLPQFETGSIHRRKSPFHGRIENVFSELIRIPGILAHPNFSLEILITREEEIRRDDGKGSWRRKGVSIIDRRLIEVLSRRRFDSTNDFLALLPGTLPRAFTNLDLATHLRISKNLAVKMSYCLRKMGGLSVEGKRGRYYLYTSQSRASLQG